MAENDNDNNLEEPQEGYVHGSSHDEMNNDDNGSMPESDGPDLPSDKSFRPKKKHRLIPYKWLRVTLRVILCIILFIIAIPFLLYVPPVQTFLKNVACNYVKKTTGMEIGIDKFRIKWPLDVSLQGVTVVEATGDTMVYAKEVIADVKMRPLLKLDVDINEVKLVDAGFRMLSPDSSLFLKIKAGLVEIDDKSSVDIKTMNINLNKVVLNDGNLSMVMDVWKQKPSPPDTSSLAMKINLHDVEINNFTFGMSMLPTIDTLALSSNSIRLRDGVIDLGENKVTAAYLGTSDGSVTFLTPTPEYIKTHPAPEPVDTVPSNKPPMIIQGDTVAVKDFKALYAVKGAKPLPGFDPSYIEVSGVNIELDNFYNEASTIKLPIMLLQARERSGLQIVDGSGTIGVDSVGLSVKDVFLRTMYSEISANATVPFALMEMKRNIPFDARAFGSIGWPDIDAFMPDLKVYTSKLPARSPLRFNLDADGSLDDIYISKLDVSVPDVFAIKADGHAANIFDFKKLQANVAFDGSISGPSVVQRFIPVKEFSIPKLAITGNASVANQAYAADFRLTTTVGDVVADGKVNMNSEKYDADVSVKDVNVASFMPDLGIGKVTATLSAHGAGFNPTIKNATTDINVDVASLQYHGRNIHDVSAAVTLNHGDYDLKVSSDNTDANFSIACDGTIAPDLYTFDLIADLRDINLEGLGITKEPNFGRGYITLQGSASPDRWLYDAELCMKDVEWTMGEEFFNIPNDIDVSFHSKVDMVTAAVSAAQTNLDFESHTDLRNLVNRFMLVGDSVTRQIAEKNLNVEGLQKALPPFQLNLTASGNGILGDYLSVMGMSLDTVYAHVGNDSIIWANAGVIEIANATMRADTLTFQLKQRGQLLDYRAHMGNRANNPLADFADVNVNGYVGSNRLMLGLNQKNQTGETGYKLGLTAAYADSVVTVHFTPLKAMIGYIPWEFNNDNYVDVNMHNMRIQAALEASSKESSIALNTQEGKNGNDELHLGLKNIHVQDFLNLSVFAPPITADVNADITVGYINNWLYGTGTLGIEDFTYDKMKVGNFDFNLRAAHNDDGSTGARVGLKIDGAEALAARAMLVPDTTGANDEKLQLKTLGLELTRFPVKIANAFLGPDIAKLSGYLNGDFNVTGKLSEPKLNGYLACDSLAVFIPMMGSSVKFNNDSILVADNVVDFNKFNIWGANKNPIVIDGTVDANHISEIMFDLDLNANNFQLINNDNRAKSDIYGKLFLNLNASAKGPMEHFSINANASVLSATDVTYQISQTTAQLTQRNTAEIVRFVNFNDTAMIDKGDSIKPAMAMRIVADLTLEPGMQVNVIYPGTTTTGNAKVEISPSGSLSYFQNYMGDMRLNGQLYIGNGYARYSMPIVGEKKFTFNPDSYVLWNGELLNPTLHISATDEVKASIIENNNSRLVNFLVGLDVTNTLSAPKVQFDLSTDDDLSIRNELMSMSPDQRSMAALNMLLTGQYSGNGVKTASSDLLQGTMYNLLTSQINGWLANNVHGVDLSLGVDQYDKTVNGESGSSTSYSYTVSKSLFNNKFKISVGGNYTTDASADENFSENLINDISFEYILKQTSNVTMYARLFRHTGYESILEGEITETGVGFLLKRRLANLKDLFRWGSGRSKSTTSTIPAITPVRSAMSNDNDTTAKKNETKK